MIYWLVQSSADCPFESDEWLSTTERERYAAFTVPKRRHDWLLGRWTAKRLLQAALRQETGRSVPLYDWVIRAEADGAPEVSVPHQLRNLPGLDTLTLSISHSGDHALCAVSFGSGKSLLGADIERVEARDEAFVRDFFTEAEQAQVAQASAALRPRLVTAIWSGKEAALKALRLGLRADTRAVSCVLEPGEPFPRSWTPFRLEWHDRPVPTLFGWWRMLNAEYVLTLVTDEPHAQVLPVESASFRSR
jgi:4'-phosphopantetheinyl transferase